MALGVKILLAALLAHVVVSLPALANNDLIPTPDLQIRDAGSAPIINGFQAPPVILSPVLPIRRRGHTTRRDRGAALAPTGSGTFHWLGPDGTMAELKVDMPGATENMVNLEELVAEDAMIEEVTCPTNATGQLKVRFAEVAGVDDAQDAWQWLNEGEENHFVVVVGPGTCGGGDGHDDRVLYMATDLVYNDDSETAVLDVVQTTWKAAAHTFDLTVGKAAPSLTKRFARSVPYRRGLFDKIKDGVSSVADTVGDAAGAVADVVVDVAAPIVAPVVDVVDQSVDVITDVADDVVDKGKDAVNKGAEAVVDVAEGVVEKGKDVVDKGKKAAKKGGKAVADAAEDVVDKGKDVVKKGKKAAKKGAKAIKDAADDVVKKGKEVVDKGKKAAKKGAKDLTDAADDVVEKGKDVVGKGKDAVKKGAEVVADVADDAVDKGKDAVKKGAEVLTDAAEDVVDKGKEVVSDGVDAVSDLVDNGKELILDGADAVADGAEVVADAVVDGAGAVADAVDVVVNPNLSPNFSIPFESDFSGQSVTFTQDGIDMSLTCTECFTKGSFDIKGRFKVQNFEFQEAFVEASTAGLTAKAVLSLSIKGELTDKLLDKSVPVFKVSPAGVSIPGVLTLGPTISVKLGAEISQIKGSVTVSLGGTASLEPSLARIDFLNKEGTTAQGFGPSFDAEPFKVDAVVEATASVFVEAALGLEISAVESGFSAELTAKLPALSASLKAISSATCTACGNFQSGIQGSLTLGTTVGVKVKKKLLGDEDDLYSVSFAEANTPEIAGFCQGFGLQGDQCLA